VRGREEERCEEQTSSSGSFYRVEGERGEDDMAVGRGYTGVDG
jgi:hypothetical protein